MPYLKSGWTQLHGIPVPDKLMEKIEDKAAREGISVSAFVRNTMATRVKYKFPPKPRSKTEAA